MLGMLIMAIADLEQLCDVADMTASMSVEGLLGTDQVFRNDLHTELRPHPGQVAQHVRGTDCATWPARASSPRTSSTTTVCRTPTPCAVLLR
jgi:hypothetical protein